MVGPRGSRIHEAPARGWMRPSWLAAGVFLLSACPLPDAPINFQEDFEACTGSCGWTVTGAGKVAIVATTHPGEHGLRLEGEVTITHVFEPPVEATAITWVSDGYPRPSVTLDSPDGGQSVNLVPTNPALDDEGNPVIEEVDGGFRPSTAFVGGSSAVLIRALSFSHAASNPPMIVDVVRVEGEPNHGPGCY
ncbi:MAG: hypothetical protein QM820_00675 [Minicystis sp.]